MSREQLIPLYLRHGVLARFAAEFGRDTADTLLSSEQFRQLLVLAGPAELLVGDQQDVIDYYQRYRPGMAVTKLGTSGVDNRVSQQPIVLLDIDNLRDHPQRAASHLVRRLWDAAAFRHQVTNRDFQLVLEQALENPRQIPDLARSMTALAQGRACRHQLQVLDQVEAGCGKALPSLYQAADAHRQVLAAGAETLNNRSQAFAIGQSVLEREPDALGTPWLQVIDNYQRGLEQFSDLKREEAVQERREQLAPIH